MTHKSISKPVIKTKLIIKVKNILTTYNFNHFIRNTVFKKVKTKKQVKYMSLLMGTSPTSNRMILKKIKLMNNLRN